MKERPILFSGPMVRALLDGRKTQTRRVVKKINPAYLDAHCKRGVQDWKENCDAMVRQECPYGIPGDRLWVRETWTADYAWPVEGAEERRWHDKMPRAFRGPKSCYYVYFAATPEDAQMAYPLDNGEIVFNAADADRGRLKNVRWQPSIHMPRWASRLTLEITGVRLEQVQEISEADAIAEGMGPEEARAAKMAEYADLRSVFSWRWDALNATRGYGWDANPWVFVIEFSPPRAAGHAPPDTPK